jgi:hypothetical protein
MNRRRSRRDAARAEIRNRWRPRLEPAELDFAPAAGDYYAVVDAIESGRVVLVLSRWPDVDAVGHLVFSGDDVTRDFTLDEWQPVVTRQRAAVGQPAPDRDPRVGDAFWVRIPDGDVEASPLAGWNLVDVTRPARRAAHAALLTAANPELRAASAAPRTVEAEPPEPPPTGSAAPAV